MPSVDLTISDCGGQVVAALRGELDVVDAEAVATALAAAADRGNGHLSGDLVLAAPQRRCCGSLR
jgi:hypothetical protein